MSFREVGVVDKLTKEGIVYEAGRLIQLHKAGFVKKSELTNSAFLYRYALNV